MPTGGGAGANLIFLAGATTYAPLVALQGPFAPLDIALVPELPAWDLAHVQPACNRHTRFLIKEVSQLLLAEEIKLPVK